MTVIVTWLILPWWPVSDVLYRYFCTCRLSNTLKRELEGTVLFALKYFLFIHVVLLIHLDSEGLRPYKLKGFRPHKQVQ